MIAAKEPPATVNEIARGRLPGSLKKLKKHCTSWDMNNNEEDGTCNGMVWDYVSNQKIPLNEKTDFLNLENISEEEKRKYDSFFNNMILTTGELYNQNQL